LRFWKRPKKAVDLLRGSLSTEMLHEPLLLDHVKIEDYLMVTLEIRPCSFFTIPSEFQNGNELGKRIDELCAEPLQAVMSVSADEKARLIRRLKRKIQDAFRDVVLHSATNEAHVKWSKKLFLQTHDVEVRPSIHELYLLKDSKIKKELRRLLRIRNAMRERVRLSMNETRKGTCLAFPEELSPEYLVSIGRLLGYPSCCVGRYVRERLREGASVEMRASEQISRLRKTGETPNVYSYFAKNFFPCEPKCRRASEIGKKTFDLLDELNSKLATLYIECMENNVGIVEGYPELTRQYRAKLTEKAQRLKET
jgi:hypothetical protein